MTPFQFQITQINDETHYNLKAKTWRKQMPFFGFVFLFLFILGAGLLFILNDLQLIWPSAHQFWRLFPLPIGYLVVVILVRSGSSSIVLGSDQISVVHRILGFTRRTAVLRFDEIEAICFSPTTRNRKNWLGLRKYGDTGRVTLVTGLCDAGEYERVARLLAGQLNVDVELRK